QLEVSVRDIEQFKRQNDLVSDEESPNGTSGSEYPEEIDLRAEDDALIAAELEAAEADAERERAEADDAGEEEGEQRGARTRRRRRSSETIAAGARSSTLPRSGGEPRSLRSPCCHW